MSGRIIFAVPKQEAPSGGTKLLYRYVDILNRRGFPAFVWHQEPGYRYRWYPVQVPTLYGKNLESTSLDLVAVPEIYGKYISQILPGVPKIIVNQHCFATFGLGYSFATTDLSSPYRDCPEVKGVLATSEETAKYLHYAFPQLPYYQVRQSVDPELFRYTPTKKKQICFLPRKNQDHAIQVITLLRMRRVLRGYDVLPIEDVVYSDYAKYLRESLFFLSFGFPEGFGMPPLEAMSSGCITVGYHGTGGKEFFTPEFGYPIEQGDILSYAKRVEQLIAEYETDPSELDAKRKRASQMTGDRYLPQIEEDQLVEVFTQVFKTGIHG